METEAKKLCFGGENLKRKLSRVANLEAGSKDFPLQKMASSESGLHVNVPLALSMFHPQNFQKFSNLELAILTQGQDSSTC